MHLHCVCNEANVLNLHLCLWQTHGGNTTCCLWVTQARGQMLCQLITLLEETDGFSKTYSAALVLAVFQSVGAQGMFEVNRELDTFSELSHKKLTLFSKQIFHYIPHISHRNRHETWKKYSKSLDRESAIGSVLNRHFSVCPHHKTLKLQQRSCNSNRSIYIWQLKSLNAPQL